MFYWSQLFVFLKWTFGMLRNEANYANISIFNSLTGRKMEKETLAAQTAPFPTWMSLSILSEAEWET